MTLIAYRGKVLADDAATVESVGFEESGFIVVFIAKPAAAPKAPEPPAAPAPATTPAAPAPAAPAPALAAEAAPAPPAAPGGLLTGSNLEGAISNLCDMGFDRAEVVACMRAAFNNPERAVEYLTTGIPPALQAVAQAPAAPAAAAAPPAGGAVAAPAPAAVGPAAQPFNMFGGPAPAAAAAAAAGGGGGALAFLHQNPQFRVLRQMLRGNPDMLPNILQELGRTNPLHLQAIQNNQPEFLRFMSEEGGEEDMAALAGMMGGEGEDEIDDEMMAMMEGAGTGAGAGAGGGMVIQLTQEDVDKVERLQALGFPRDACIEALLACDKNEELAANFLLGDQMFD